MQEVRVEASEREEMSIENLAPSDDFKKWHEKRYPEKCVCGKKINEYKLFINEVAKCEDCFREATKHMVFG